MPELDAREIRLAMVAAPPAGQRRPEGYGAGELRPVLPSASQWLYDHAADLLVNTALGAHANL